jgi:histidine triad (HIT) family protein
LEECIFCKIANKEVPAHIVYEDSGHMAFLDRSPVTPGHTLVITKTHCLNMLDASDDSLQKLAVVVKKVARAVLKGAEAHGVNVSMNNGKAAGQLVQHVHWHVIPRFINDGLRHWPHGSYKEGQADEVAKRIRKALDSQ